MAVSYFDSNGSYRIEFVNSTEELEDFKNYLARWGMMFVGVNER